MATRRFTEYIVEGRTYYKRHHEEGLAKKRAQKLADSTGKPVTMEIISGWIQEDPDGFVADSKETSKRHKVFKPKYTPSSRIGAEFNPSSRTMSIPAHKVVINPGRSIQIFTRGGGRRNPPSRRDLKTRYQVVSMQGHDMGMFDTKPEAMSEAKGIASSSGEPVEVVWGTRRYEGDPYTYHTMKVRPSRGR